MPTQPVFSAARDRRVTLVTAGIVAAILIVWLLAVTKWITADNFTLLRSNSVTATVGVATATPERVVCARDQLIPRGTEVLALQLAPAPRRAPTNRRLKVSIEGGARPVVGDATVTRRAHVVSVPLDTSVARTIVGGSVCIHAPDAPVQLRGSVYASTGWTDVAGKRLDHTMPRISYLSATPVSAASQIGQVLKRASMFRVGWVGPWTYWLLAALVSFALLAALAALILRGNGGWSDRRWMVLIGLVVLANGLTWSIVTPPLQGPDEGAHLAYVETLADRSLSDAGSRAYSPQLDLLNYRTVLGIALNPTNKLPWFPVEEQAYKRLENSFKPGDPAVKGTAAAQYAPLYYGLAVIPYKLTPGGVIAKDWGLRLFSILLTIGTALMVFLTARQLAPRTEWIAPFAGLFAAFEPMLLHIGASAHLDPFVILLTSILIYLVARAFREGIDVKRALAIGTTLALATIAKPISIALVPAVLLAAIILLRRERTERRAALRIVLAGTIPFLLLVGGVYAAFHGTSDAVVGPSGGHTEIPITPSAFLSYSWQWFLPKLWFMSSWFGGGTWNDPPPFFTVIVPGFFANFNYLDTQFPFDVMRVIAAIGLSATVLALVGAVKHWRDRANWLPFTVFGVTALLATTAFLVVYGFILAVKFNAALIQGRYFLPLIALFALFFAAAAFSASRRWGIAIATVLIALLALLNISGYAISLARFYL